MGSCSGGNLKDRSAMQAEAAPAKASGCGCSGVASASRSGIGMSEPLAHANRTNPLPAYSSGTGYSRGADVPRQMPGTRHVTLAEDRSLAGAGQNRAQITTLADQVSASAIRRIME